MNILHKIVDQTRLDLEKRKKGTAFSDFQSFESYHRNRRSFYKSIALVDNVSIIAEVKKASPSKGVIRPDFDPVDIANCYEKNGAAAISVLTDKPFFQGDLSYMKAVSEQVSIPVLRKDFIIDPYQIEEARAWGADAVLLIVKILNGSLLNELIVAAEDAGLGALVECYDQKDWDRLDFSLCKSVGVNNRNLGTFEVNVHQGLELLSTAPAGIIRVSESGLHHPDDMLLLKKNNIHSALIGEQFMRTEHVGKELKRFINIQTNEHKS